MKLGLGTKKAMLSGGWAQATARYKIKEGEIYMFSFCPSDLHGLILELIPCEEVASSTNGMISTYARECYMDSLNTTKYLVC